MQFSFSLWDVLPVDDKYGILKRNSLSVFGMSYQWMKMETSLTGTLFAVFAAVVGLAVLTQVLIYEDVFKRIYIKRIYIQIVISILQPMGRQ